MHGNLLSVFNDYFSTNETIHMYNTQILKKTAHKTTKEQIVENSQLNIKEHKYGIVYQPN